MKIPGLSLLTTPIKVALGILVGAVVVYLLVFKAIPAYDSWRERQRQEHLTKAGAQGDSAKADINSGALFAAKADTEYVPYAVYRNSPVTRGNPVANELGNRADKVIADLKTAHTKDTSAITHLEKQVNELQAAGPPPPPRIVPYVDAGYGLSNRHRAVPVVRVGLDYRLAGPVAVKLEGSYEPPPAGSEVQKPEFRGLAALHISFR